jgi:citrate lyase subunit beta/citryl-CoA lyase
MRLRRSCLAVPGTAARMLEKARALEADEVFLDLEDAVTPADKTDRTRAQVVAALRAEGWRASTRAVRVNGVATRWCYRDVVQIVSGAREHVHSLVVPKVHDASHVHFVDHLLTQLELDLGLEQGGIALELLIETAHGALELPRIAAASSRTEALIFGPGDLAASLGIPQLTLGAIEHEYPGDQWHYLLSRLVMSARAHGLQAIDGPYAQIRDLDGLRDSARRSRLLGLDGKYALHPDQIAPLNEIYSPSQAQFDRALDMLEAYRRAVEVEHRGAVMLDGEMIDEASRKMALQVEAAGREAGLERSRRA